MANAASAEFSPRFRLTIRVRDGRTERTASIDYRTRELLQQQERQFDRKFLSPFDLLTFKNEAGEILAIVARAYVSRSVSAI
jgi:hypothetical protein